MRECNLMVLTNTQGAGVTVCLLQVSSRGVGHEVTSVGCHGQSNTKTDGTWGASSSPTL